MNFGKALKALKRGELVWRKDWYNKDMWLELQTPNEDSKMNLPYIYLSIPSCGDSETARVPWVASQTDLLAEDWQCSI
jgi:hypothetical protein